MDQLELAGDLVDAGLFNSSYEDIVRANVRLFFTTPYARAWWESYKGLVEKGLADPAAIPIIDDELEGISPETARDFFRTTASKLSE